MENNPNHTCKRYNFEKLEKIFVFERNPNRR